MFEPLVLCFALLQTRGSGNFRDSRGLSSSTVDLYSGNWAKQVYRDLHCLLCSPTQRCSCSFGSFSEPQRSPTTFPYSVSLPHTHILSLLTLTPKDLPPQFRSKDIFSRQTIFFRTPGLFFKIQAVALCLPVTDRCVFSLINNTNIGVTLVPP